MNDVDIVRTAPARMRAANRKVSASRQIYEELRSQIIALEHAPGTSLSRQALAGAYEISQTPVRDAFLRLEQEGLVEIYPQSRTVVARIDVDHARETQFLRIALELEVTRALAKDSDKARIEPARRILRMQRIALEDDNDLVEFNRLDQLLHGSLCEAVGYPDLWLVVASRSGHIDRLRKLNLPDPGKAALILSDHEEIFDGIAESNLHRTAAAVRNHLSGTLSAVDDIMARNPQYF